MSHVVTVEVEISDLEALEAACKRLGFEFREGSRTFKWYNSWVDDTRLPDGIFSPEETARLRAGSAYDRKAAMEAVMGRCDHEIRVPGAAYSVGVCKKENGRFGLRWDFYSAGGLEQRMGGTKGERLLQAYTIEKTRREAQRRGWRVTETKLTGGQVKLALVKG